MRHTKDTSLFNELDPKVHSVILSFCDAKTMIQLLGVSKAWRRLAASRQFWKFLLERDLFTNVKPPNFEEKKDQELQDLEAGANKTTIQHYPLIDEYRNNVEEIRLSREQMRKATALDAKYRRMGKLFFFGRAMFLNSHAASVILPLFLFTVLLAVKMDKPEIYSWVVTFIPFYIFDFLIFGPIVSYWLFQLFCPVMFIPAGEGGEFNQWVFRWNFILKSFQYFPHKHKWATAWKVFNSLCLLLWVGFTITFPLGLDLHSGLLINVSFVLMILSGLYALFISKLIWDAVNDREKGLHDIYECSFSISPLSMVPGILISGILWFMRWRLQGHSSYTVCLIPMFISNVIMLLSPFWPKCFIRCIPWRVENFQEFRIYETPTPLLASCCLVVPFIVFEVLLLHHMDKYQFTAVVVFIPLWILLGIAGCIGSLVCFGYICEKSYELDVLPNAFAKFPQRKNVPYNMAGW
jgi:hypothetical protein